MNNFEIFMLIAFGVMTIVTFAVFAADKIKAKKDLWRIPEVVLFACCFLLGGVGGLLGMYICRHKTRHWYFVVFVPIFAIISVAAVVLTFIYT